MQTSINDSTESPKPARPRSPINPLKSASLDDSKTTTERKQPDFISKNKEKLKKNPNNLNIPEITIVEIIDNETPKVKPKGNPTVNRAKSLSRPTTKKPQEDSKLAKPGTGKTLKSLQIKDSLIDSLLRVDERSTEIEGRASPQRASTPVKVEEKQFKRSGSKAPESNNEITTSLKSQEVLANKFIKEFQSTLAEIGKTSETIDLKTTIELLTRLRFIKNDPLSGKSEENSAMVGRLWKLINGELTAKVQNLLCVCLNIMHLYSPSGHLADSECTNIKSWSFLHGIFVYNSDEALKIHRTFYQFYQNRRLAPKKVTESQDLSADYSFKPQINRISRDLASEGRNRYGSLGTQKREEYLNKKKEEITKQRDLLVKTGDEVEVKNSNFQPTLLARSGSKQKKIEIQLKSPAPRPEPRKAPVAIKKDPVLKEFTSPKTEKSKLEVNQEFYSAKVQKEIERMKKVRDEKEKEKKVETNIFRHKKSNSFANNEGPVRAFNLRPNSNSRVEVKKPPNLDSMTDRSEVIVFENNVSLNSPLLLSDTQSVEVFEDRFDKQIREFGDDEIPDESYDRSYEAASRIPSLKVPNHATALQLINFINEHNLTEDSAEKLLQIFNLTPKVT